MENDEVILTQNYFKSSYKREDITQLPSYKEWIKAKNQQNKKVVKCPWCLGVGDMKYLKSQLIIHVQCVIIFIVKNVFKNV